ncbi:hypothetical protein TB2_034080 [Malus domestica]
MGYVGSDFIWTDNRDEEVWCRLDHAFSNISWLQLFLESRVCHLNPFESDHLPLIVEIQSTRSGKIRRGKRFKFEEIWLQREGCENMIKTVWSTSSI